MDEGRSGASFSLATDADWHGAGRELVSGLLALPEGEARVSLLERLCERLGKRLYPAFLQILHVVAQHAGPPGREAVASTLVDCLLSGRLPSGHLSAWGSIGQSGDPAFGQRRTLGPIEYVCAWYAQPSEQQALDRVRFDRALSSLLELIGSDGRARELYARKLLADAENPLEGSLSGRTRTAIEALASRWCRDPAPEAAVLAFIDALDDRVSLDAFASYRPPGSR